MLWLWPSRSHLKGSADLGKQARRRRNGALSSTLVSGPSKRPFAFTLRGNPHESETAAPSNGHSRSGIEEAEHLRRSHSLASVFFARSARPPSIDRYKKQEGARARAASDVKISQARFPGEIRSKKQLPRAARERELLFSAACPPASGVKNSRWNSDPFVPTQLRRQALAPPLSPAAQTE